MHAPTRALRLPLHDGFAPMAAVTIDIPLIARVSTRDRAETRRAAAADVVVSKPGYGIVSECVANGTALLYTSRGRFAEYDLFVEEMPRLLRCRFLSQDDLFAGRWADAVEALLAQPAPRERVRLDGADAAADHVLAFDRDSR